MRPKSTSTIRFVAIVSASLLPTGPALGQATSLVSVSSDGAQGNWDTFYCAISADGRFVALESLASNFVRGDTNSAHDVFVRDRQLGTTERVSVASGGAEAHGNSTAPSISADGRYVAFMSDADDLVAGDTNGVRDVFVHDRLSGTTERVSINDSGTQGVSDSYYPSISADGRCVAFSSSAANLAPGDTNGYVDVFVRDRLLGTTERVSLDSAGAQGNGGSGYGVSISADGRYVAFMSDATNLVAGDTNGTTDIFVRDRRDGTTERVTVSTQGVQANFPSGQYGLSISGDGRYVAFESAADNLIAGDTNMARDIFVRDRRNGTTGRVSVGSGGSQGDFESHDPVFSADGRYVAFESIARNLVPGDTNEASDAFVHDLLSDTTERVSVSTSGAQGNWGSGLPSISADGRYVAFSSEATNLVSGDTTYSSDVFVRDRTYFPFTSSCDPGLGGVLSCPCSNPPLGPGRGCDNSSGTGGAIFWASGVAYLSADSLVFTTDLETPSALSIVMQGNGGIPSGVLYGQGVRCLGGTVIRRLYVKQAFAGSITAPDLAAGDPPVTARSAEKGDVIQPGESRWYLVYYRDPVVRGGCPAGSTFNSTQTGRIDWIP